jgi:hypothetical protein
LDSFRTAADAKAGAAADVDAGVPNSDDGSLSVMSTDACDELWALIADVDGGRSNAAEDAAVADDDMSSAFADLNADFSAAATADDEADAAT